MARFSSPIPIDQYARSAAPSRLTLQASSALADALSAIAGGVRKSQGEVIFSEGTPALGVYLLREGTLRAMLTGLDGSPIIDRVLAPGALLGVPAAMCAKQFQFTVTALRDCELGYVETSALNDFLRAHPELCMEVVQMMSDELLELRKPREHMHGCGHPECSLYDACNRYPI